MTWEGREVAHCTSIPEVAPGDDFLSLFTSVPRNATEQLAKLKAFRQRMHARAERRTVQEYHVNRIGTQLGQGPQ